MEEKKTCSFPEESERILERFKAGDKGIAFIELRNHIRDCPVCANRFYSFCYVEKLFGERKKEEHIAEFLKYAESRCAQSGIDRTKCMTLYEMFITRTYSENTCRDAVFGQELSLAQEFYDLLGVNLPVEQKDMHKNRGLFYRWATYLAPVAITLLFSVQWVSGQFMVAASSGSPVIKSMAFPTFDMQAFYTPKDAYKTDKVEAEYTNFSLPVDNALKKTYDLSFDSEESENTFKIINISFK
jgi:hypothetical protein